MISIIIPVYNVEKYIKECLDSLLNQTYKNFEIIIVDDGSTDNSIEIINDYKEKFNKIKILTQENKGVSEARNKALCYAEGDYILYIDPDDFAKVNMLETMINKAKELNSDIVIADFYLYFNMDDKRNRIHTYNSNDILTSNRVIDMMLNYRLEGQLWNKLFKSSILKQNNFYFEPNRYIQDVFPVFKLISKCKKIAFINEPLYYYRQRNTSTVHKKTEKLADDYFHAMNSILGYIKEKNLKINSKSLKTFKAIVLSRFIAFYTNYDHLNVYKDFNKSKYNVLNIKFKDFLNLDSLSRHDKCRLILWKLRLFNICKKIKNFK